MKNLLLTTLLCSLFVTNVSAQQKADSLFGVFEKSTSYPQRLKAANQIIAFLHSQETLEKPCTVTVRTPEDSICMLVYGGGGTYFYHQSDYERAKRYAEMGIKACEALKDTTMLSECLDILGVCYIRSGVYDKAYETMELSLKIAEQRKDNEGIATVYSNMGTLYSYMKKDSLAISLYLKSIAITRTLNDDGALARRLSNLGEAYARIKQPQKGLLLFKEALALDTKAGHADRAAIRQSNMANAYMEMGQYAEAEKNYRQAIETLRRMDKKSSLAISCYQMGLLKEKTSQPQQAAAYFKEAETIARKIGFTYILRNTGEGLYRVNKSSNPALALRYLEESKALGDSLYKAEKEKQINEFEVRYQTQEKESQLLLNEQKLKTARLFRWLLTAVILLLVVFAGYLLYSARLRKQQNRRLAEANATKDKLFSIISHDLKSPAVAQKVALDSLIKHSERYDAETIGLLGSFHDASEAQFSLLQNLLNWASMQTGKMTYNPMLFDLCETIHKAEELYLVSAKNKNLKIVTDTCENCLVRADREMINTVVRNLLNNAVKFSNAGDVVKIAVSTSGAHTRLSISDNGVGMSQQQIEELLRSGKNTSKEGTGGEKGSGLGLTICKELLERNGSRLEIESEKGKGTVFSFNLPNI